LQSIGEIKAILVFRILEAGCLRGDRQLRIISGLSYSKKILPPKDLIVQPRLITVSEADEPELTNQINYALNYYSLHYLPKSADYRLYKTL
jgi:hypothetical protein